MPSFHTTVLVAGLVLAGVTAFPSTNKLRQLDASNEYQAPTDTDSRSPCPGLNTLANHGFLPRNGKNLTVQMVSDTLQSACNIDGPGSALLSGQANQFLNANGTFDLSDLALHGVVEHDASLTHDDANGATFAPIATNTTKVDLLLKLSSDGAVFDARDFALAKYIIESRLATPLSARQQNIADMEPPLALHVFGNLRDDGTPEISLAALENVFKFNRLPDGFVRPAVQITIPAVGATTAAFLARKAELKSYGQ
ncbi:HEME-HALOPEROXIDASE domain-containing protein [Mycena kentingensis (nom. inval.)]|nr:HEME-HALOPEROXIDASE domain-containing protein [Mycena kentingensis (nom. inval.)]